MHAACMQKSPLLQLTDVLAHAMQVQQRKQMAKACRVAAACNNHHKLLKHGLREFNIRHTARLLLLRIGAAVSSLCPCEQLSAASFCSYGLPSITTAMHHTLHQALPCTA